MTEKTPIHEIVSISSPGDRMDAKAHEVDLQAIVSHPIAIGDVAGDFTNEQKYFVLKRLEYDHLLTLEDLPPGATFMLEKINQLEIPEALDILREYLKEHDGDVNISTHQYDNIQELVNNSSAVHSNLKASFKDYDDTKKGSVEEAVFSSGSLESDPSADWALKVKTEAGMIAYWSPYAEVRAVTDPYDDPTVPCETLRVYIIGLVWMVLGAFINQYFSERFPSITLSSYVVQLFVYPCGVFLAKVLPLWKIKVWKWTWDLNPGPWTYKEQMLATICYSVSGAAPYVSYNIHVQKLFYHDKWATFGYQVLLSLATNFMGFGLAGVVRKFVVYPVKSIWPTILPTLALNKALMVPEKKENLHGWTISRYNFYFLTFAASFLYFWFPDYIFQALSTFNWMTWIAPNNVTLAVITGSVSGLGFNPIASFDWNILSSNSPLTIPFFSQASQFAGTLLASFCILAVWYTNYKWTSFMPINSNTLFTNTGEPYRVTAILNESGLLDKSLYDNYGPPFYTAANLVSYGAFFALYPFTIVYIGVMYWQQLADAFVGLYRAIKNARSSTFEGFHDPFCRSMSRYKEVPEWAFLIILVISIVLAILCVELYPTETPVWGIFFALALNFIFLIPLAIVYSTTGYLFGLNVLVELIVGYALPGNGQALMFIKALGYNIDGQADNYITDQKMGHYLKIPPRALFRVQILSVFIYTFVSLGTMNLSFSTITDYCSAHQPQKFTCQGAKTFYSASVLWGVIGPKKVFNGLYPVLQWCFLIGFLLAFPCVAIKKWGGKLKAVKYFQPILIIGGFLYMPPYNLSYFTGGLIISYFFMHHIRTRYLAWWSKYTYVLGGGLSAGVAFASIIIFFSVQYHEKDIVWWGNSVMYAGQDALGPSRLLASESAPDGYFGPRVGHYP